MGFGLKEQKLLWHKVREIGVANQISCRVGVSARPKLFQSYCGLVFLMLVVYIKLY
jgi:hypothetical protein